MKKIILLGALFFLVGAGCASTPKEDSLADVGDSTATAPVVADTIVPEAPEESAFVDDESSETLEEGKIGFTVMPSEAWGTFSVDLYKRWLSGNPDAGDNWEYKGSFSENDKVIYRASDPEHIIGRGGYAGDVLGYEKRSDGYYVFVQGSSAIKVPESLVAEEVPLANGMALLVQGPEESDGPSPFPNTPGDIVVYINTPNGPLRGGVFMALSSYNDGQLVSAEEMKELLLRVTIN